MGLFDVLTVVFIVLRLCGVIAWPWIYIIMPTLIHITLWALLFIFGADSRIKKTPEERPWSVK